MPNIVVSRLPAAQWIPSRPSWLQDHFSFRKFRIDFAKTHLPCLNLRILSDVLGDCPASGEPAKYWKPRCTFFRHLTRVLIGESVNGRFSSLIARRSARRPCDRSGFNVMPHLNQDHVIWGDSYNLNLWHDISG